MSTTNNKYIKGVDKVASAIEHSDLPDHITVIAGGLADRGISFVSTNYDWHITSNYYVRTPNGKTTVAMEIQRSCRLVGNFDDAIQLHLYAMPETIEALKKVFGFRKSG